MGPGCPLRQAQDRHWGSSKLLHDETMCEDLTIHRFAKR